MKWRLPCLVLLLYIFGLAGALIAQGAAGDGEPPVGEQGEGEKARDDIGRPGKPASRPAAPEEKKQDEQETSHWLQSLQIIGKPAEPEYVHDVIWPEDHQVRSLSNTVEGSLERLAGFDMKRQSFSGNQNSRLRIRGFDESRYRVLLDGRPLHGAGVYGGYYVDWNSLSLENVERIEVIRGLAPAKYGNTLGGVLNIITRYGTEEPETKFRIGGAGIRHVDGLGLWGASASHSWGRGPLLWSVAVGRYDTTGFLRNAFVKRDTLGVALAFKLPSDVRLKLAGRYTRTEAGMVVYNMPDSPHYDSEYPKALGGQLGGPNLPFRNHGPGLWGPLDWGDGSYWRDDRLTVALALVRDNDDFGFDIGPYYIDQNRSEHFMAVTNDHDVVMRRDSEPEKNNWGWRADFKNAFDAFGEHTLEYGAAGHYLGYGDIDVRGCQRSYFLGPPAPAPPHPNLQDSEGKENVSKHNGVYVQDRWKVTKWFEIFPGIRFDHFRADGPAGTEEILQKRWGPRFATTLRPWKGARVTGRYGRAYRFPTIPEYYWYYSGYQPAGRTALTGERADQWELELGYKVKKRSSVSARGYYYDVDDYIRTVFGYRPSRVVYNTDNMKLWGVEIEARRELPHDFFVWGNYTWQRTRKSGDVLDSSSVLSDELVELPEHKFNVGIGYEKEKGLAAELALRFVGNRQSIQGNLTRPGGAYLESMSRYFDLDFSASYPVCSGKDGEEVRIGVRVDNIIGRHYQEEYGYPMPGPTVMINLWGNF